MTRLLGATRRPDTDSETRNFPIRTLPISSLKLYKFYCGSESWRRNLRSKSLQSCWVLTAKRNDFGENRKDKQFTVRQVGSFSKDSHVCMEIRVPNCTRSPRQHYFSLLFNFLGKALHLFVHLKSFHEEMIIVQKRRYTFR